MQRVKKKEDFKRQRSSSNKEERGLDRSATINKTWFSAELLFVALTDGQWEADPLCEESIIIIRATSEPRAKETAKRTGLKMEHAYRNEDGELIQWKLLGILQIQDLCQSLLTSGEEVFSRLFLGSEATSAAVRELLDRKRRPK